MRSISCNLPCRSSQFVSIDLDHGLNPSFTAKACLILIILALVIGSNLTTRPFHAKQASSSGILSDLLELTIPRQILHSLAFNCSANAILFLKMNL
jgi:hypothetical protein